MTEMRKFSELNEQNFSLSDNDKSDITHEARLMIFIYDI